MQTAAWGPHTWVLFHTVAFNYPTKPTEDDRDRYRRFYTGLQEILPCKYCRVSYGEFIQERPLESYLRDREGGIFWTYMIHDRVNHKLGKQSCPFEQYVRTYENMRAKCAKRVGATGNLISGCTEPMRNFDTEDEITTYARAIWNTYAEEGGAKGSRQQRGGARGTSATEEASLLSAVCVAMGLITAAVFVARP